MNSLKVKEVTKSFKGRTVVNEVSFSVFPGEVVGLLGPNGAGKTTSFYMVVGLLKPDKGSILYMGEDVTLYPMYKRARKGISYLPQETSVFRKLTVEQNLMAVFEVLSLTHEERVAKLNQLLKELGILHLKKNKAYSLSGGECRRVEIARALVLSPKFILLDEPFAGIDPIAVADIQCIVEGLKNRGIGVLVTDHNVRETLTICDRAYILNDGVIIEEGTPYEISESQTAREIYLGDKFRL